MSKVADAYMDLMDMEDGEDYTESLAAEYVRISNEYKKEQQ
jgi:hypothetical protein